MEDIENECRAITKLCVSSNHPNIVKVIRHGWLPFNPLIYYIDMEYLPLTLEEHIMKNISILDCCIESASVGKVEEELLPVVWTSLKTTSNIVGQIVSGLVFIHSYREVHRDLKPRNGNVPHAGSHLTFSVIFIVDRGLETCRFRHML